MRTMRAAVLYAANTPMVIEEVQLDDPGPNEVLVKVAAGGVCRTDLHVLKGEWTSRFPIVLGHEAAGAVAAVGAGVTRVRPGDPIWRPQVVVEHRPARHALVGVQHGGLQSGVARERRRARSGRPAPDDNEVVHALVSSVASRAPRAHDSVPDRRYR